MDIRKYYIGMKICDYYTIHIIERNWEDKVMVLEEDLDGFVQCLEYFGFHY